MTQYKKFHLGDVLSITTGRLVSPRHMDGIYDILNHMTGDDLFTHQLPRACKECAPLLLITHPELAKTGSPESLAKLDTLIENAKHHEGESADTAIEMWLKWMAEPGNCDLKMEYEIGQIPQEAHQHRDPVEELREMAGSKKVIVVQT